MGLSLAQKVFDIVPDWLRVRIFELTEEEKFFLEVARENRIAIRDYICCEEEYYGQIIDCKQRMETMKFLLNKYGEGRFHKYFSEKKGEFEQYFRVLLGYR
jgi:hypothetical protein